ncbi:hypothetical protein PMIN06_005056 [Paraphaeosphaeria minitans]
MFTPYQAPSFIPYLVDAQFFHRPCLAAILCGLICPGLLTWVYSTEQTTFPINLTTHPPSMSPLNSSLPLVSASNNTEKVGATQHTGIQLRWVPLLFFAIIVTLIIIIIVMPKSWMINLYNRIGRASKHCPKIASRPRRIFSFFSSRSCGDEQQLSIETSSRQRRERDASFIDVHLREIRGFQQPELQKVERPEPAVSGGIGPPLPVLHRDKVWRSFRPKRFLGSRTLGVLRYS